MSDSDLYDENGECLYEVDTDDVLAESYGIEDNGDFVMYADNGLTDICVRVLGENMRVVVEAYLKRHPEWASPEREGAE